MIHCDFFKLDPRSFGVVKPVVNSKLLFQNFGIETLRWSEGNFCSLLREIPYNLPAFSSSAPGLLMRFVYSL